MKSIHRSATSEQRILIEEARAEGRAEGYRDGFADGVTESMLHLEAHGHSMGAQRLREAKIVERTDNG
jgi:flagellar biosynthesis/type III secretory pathway protein FliH